MPDCEECEYVAPKPLRQNILFLDVIGNCLFSRDINGRLDFNVFIKIIDLYGEILKLDAYDKLELIRKAQFISSIEEEHRSNKSENKPIGRDKNTKMIGSRRR